VVWLRSTQDCLLDGVRSPGVQTFTRLSGGQTARVRVVAAGTAPHVVALDSDVDATALRAEGSVAARRWTPPP
jgi:hypothetical protein